MLNQECTPMDISKLEAEARAAYSQRRTRECFAVTKSLLQADPENEEGLWLQSQIRADIQQDLRDARGLLEQSGTDDEKKKYRKAAEIILLKTLNLDPENQEAKVLLQSARAMSGVAHVVPIKPDDIPFVAAPPLGQKQDKKRTRFKIPFTLLAIAILIGGLLLVLRGRRTSPEALAGTVTTRTESVNRTENQRASAETPYSPAPAPAPAPVPSSTLLSVTSTAKPAAPAAQIPIVAPPPAFAAAAAPAPAPSAAPAANVPPVSEMGKLSVTSPTQ